MQDEYFKPCYDKRVSKETVSAAWIQCESKHDVLTVVFLTKFHAVSFGLSTDYILGFIED